MRPGENPLVEDTAWVVLQRIANGDGIKEVAAALGKGRSTIDYHLRAIRAKLNARTTAHAVAIAIRERYID
jgi:DNA-binding CsgD family transcriptional regulator